MRPQPLDLMPVIVIGADTRYGRSALSALLPRQGEVRAFVTDPEQAAQMKADGVKVAIGDVSDASHVGGAGLNSFSAVLIAEAASDARQRSFATTPDEVYAAWAEGIRDAGVKRVIWLDDGGSSSGAEALRAAAPEFVRVVTADRSPEEVGAEVARLDDLASL